MGTRDSSPGDTLGTYGHEGLQSWGHSGTYWHKGLQIWFSSSTNTQGLQPKHYSVIPTPDTASGWEQTPNGTSRVGTE